MAGIKQPLQDILARLKTLQVTNGDGNTTNIHTRIWNNQLQYNNDGKLADFKKPAAFVEIVAPVQWEQLGIGFRNAELGINVHIIHEQYDAQDGTMEDNLTVFDLRDQVVRLLSNFRPFACSPLWSISEAPDYEHTNIYHYVISFVCNFVDSKGSYYDPQSGNYIDSVPPTELSLTVTKSETPIDKPPREFKVPTRK